MAPVSASTVAAPPASRRVDGPEPASVAFATGAPCPVSAADFAPSPPVPAAAVDADGLAETGDGDDYGDAAAVGVAEGDADGFFVAVPPFCAPAPPPVPPPGNTTSEQE